MNSPIKPQKKVGLILRIKYGIGVFFILLGLISSVGTLILFIYAFKGNLFAIIFLITTYTYLYGFCKRNQKIIDFAYWFEGQKWFNHFEVINEEAIPDNSCIFAFHPHNIFAVSYNIIHTLRGSPLCNKVVPLASRFITHFGPHCIFSRWWGIEAVNPSNFKRLLNQKKNIMLIPGGYEEATITSTQEYRLYLKNRKGFIKYGLQAGYKVCPVFSFGENKCYRTTDKFMKLRLFLNKYKLLGTLVWSNYLLIPEPNASIYVVIGKAIQLPKIEQPTQQDIDKYHKIYTEELENLFNRHVEKCDPGAKLYIDKQF